MRFPEVVSQDSPAPHARARAPATQKLSIIVPVYMNEENLPETVPKLLALEQSLGGLALELVFVDDGSRDGSLELLLAMQRADPERIRVVKLTRNFGAMAAVQAGLGYATGDCVGTIAADLQDPPELFLRMVEEWRRGTKVVIAVRAERQDSPLQKMFSNMYYALMRSYAISDYPAGGFDVLLADREVVDAVTRINEKNTNLLSLVFWMGYGHFRIPYVRTRRRKGKSTWTLSKKIKLFIDSFVAFSYAPIRFASVVGLLFAATAFIYAGVVFAAWWRNGIAVEGFAALMIFMAFTAGLQMTILGVIGEYLWRTLDETRKRPTFVVDRVFEPR